MNTVSASLRRLIALAAMAAVAACQSLPQPAFSSAQREVLVKYGFEERDGNYLLGINNKLLFPFDSSEIEPPKQTMLRSLGRELATVGIASAKIEGHASNEGDPDYNLKLSNRRAQAVSTAMVEGGMNGQRMRVLALGALDPVVSNDRIEGRQQNRRVVIIVTPSDVLAW